MLLLLWYYGTFTEQEWGWGRAEFQRCLVLPADLWIRTYPTGSHLDCSWQLAAPYVAGNEFWRSGNTYQIRWEGIVDGGLIWFTSEFVHHRLNPAYCESHSWLLWDQNWASGWDMSGFSLAELTWSMGTDLRAVLITWNEEEIGSDLANQCEMTSLLLERAWNLVAQWNIVGIKSNAQIIGIEMDTIRLKINK